MKQRPWREQGYCCERCLSCINQYPHVITTPLWLKKCFSKLKRCKITNNIKTMKCKYGGYLRKSSEAREKQALSISSQKEAIKSKFPDLEIVWFSESRSAFEPNNRPEFSKMINMALNDELYGIVAWHPDRLSRNEKDAG